MVKTPVIEIRLKPYGIVSVVAKGRTEEELDRADAIIKDIQPELDALHRAVLLTPRPGAGPEEKAACDAALKSWRAQSDYPGEFESRK